MALDATILGTALYNKAMSYNNVAIDPATLEAQRLAWWKDIAGAIIDHFKANAELLVPGLGLTAGAVAVAGESVTGTIE